MSTTTRCRIPEGAYGGWEIRRRLVTEEEAEKEAAVAAVLGDPRLTVGPGLYTVLVRDGVVWMSDSETELADHTDVLREVERRGGRVLVHGLGLGLILREILAFETVEHVDVVELEPAVIALVGRSLGAFVDAGRLTIHEGDCFAYDWPDDAYWTVVWHDIWPDITVESRAEADVLEQRFADRCDWQTSWR